jgi:preprotein translocase subunit SecB
MLKSPIELKEFFITKLNVDWVEGKEYDKPEGEISLGFDFDAASREGFPNEFKYEFRVIGIPEKGYEGIKFRAHLDGFFSFPEDMDQKQMLLLLAINGASILYGILRGQLANITGSFPGGKITLPAVTMEDVIPEVLKAKNEKAQETQRAQQEIPSALSEDKPPKKTKKKTTRKTSKK